ncbi:MAG: hypothetical protein ACRC0V_01645 [Fusobacteriaceae bacterium]
MSEEKKQIVPIRIKLSELKHYVSEGYTKKALAETYGFDEKTVTELLKQAELTIKKRKMPKFILEQENETIGQEKETIEQE